MRPLDNSEEGEKEEEGHLAKMLAIARATVLTCGRGPNTKAHLLTEDTGLSNTVPTASTFFDDAFLANELPDGRQISVSCGARQVRGGPFQRSWRFW